MSAPSCSVVMVSYRTGPALFAAVDRVLAQPGLQELILVDNGNPPEVVEKLRQRKIMLLTGHGNIGFARGCNLGAARAGGEYILLLNPDCLLGAEALVHAMRALEETGATLAGCHLLNPDGSEQRGGRRALLTPRTAIGEALGLSLLNQHDTRMPDETHEVAAISGAFMCLRRADWEKLGGMDAGFFLHVEDLDFCMRVQQAGGRIICAPEAKAVHLRSTSDAPSAFVEWHKTKGFIRYFHKHFGAMPGWQLRLMDAAILARGALKITLHVLLRLRGEAVDREGLKLLLIYSFLESPPRVDWAGESVIITGATSQVGLCIIGRVLSGGGQVIAVSRRPPPFYHARLRWVRAQKGKLLERVQARLAVHCAPLWALPAMLPDLKEAGVERVAALGSTSMFVKSDSSDPRERKVVQNLVEGEQRVQDYCEAAGIGWTILRPTLIYGVGLDGNVSRIARTIRQFRFFPLYPPATGLRRPVHADDLAQGALSAVTSEAARDKSYNLGGGEILPYRAMVERIFRAMGKAPLILPAPFLPRALDVLGRIRHNSGVSGEMARRMNEDLSFPDGAPARDFAYAPRAFLAGGVRDITGPVS